MNMVMDDCCCTLMKNLSTLKDHHKVLQLAWSTRGFCLFLLLICRSVHYSIVLCLPAAMQIAWSLGLRLALPGRSICVHVAAAVCVTLRCWPVVFSMYEV